MSIMSVTAAISIAVDVARELGLAIEEAIPLRSTNNAVMWLRPTDVVAKVSREANSRLLTELQVAQELVALRAPVVSPASEVPAIVHRHSGFEMTFWRYHPQSSAAEIPVDRVAFALRQLHVSLSRLSAELMASLPSYTAELAFVRSLLADRAALPALTAADRDLLSSTFDRLLARLNELAPTDRFVVLHGSPHSYNVLLADDEPVFIDFETACTGPLEWDLAHLESQAAPFFADSVQTEVLWLCRAMVSVKTATLCTAETDRGDLREHAEYHLARVRENVVPENG
jgi:Ser/Thr protein kinase RdoA (MazF antagonist)